MACLDRVAGVCLKAMDAGRYLTVGLVKHRNRLRAPGHRSQPLGRGGACSGERCRNHAAGALTLALRRAGKAGWQTATGHIAYRLRGLRVTCPPASVLASLVGLISLGIRVAEVRMTLSIGNVTVAVCANRLSRRAVKASVRLPPRWFSAALPLHAPPRPSG